jgi:hypothetical protein
MLSASYFCGVGVDGFGLGWFVGAGAVWVVFVFPRTDPVACDERLVNTESEIEVSMKMTAAQVVALLNTVVEERGPKAVWLPAPPNAAAMSALCPLCSSTTMMMNKQTMM